MTIKLTFRALALRQTFQFDGSISKVVTETVSDGLLISCFRSV